MSRCLTRDDWKALPLGTRVKILRFLEDDYFFDDSEGEGKSLIGQIATVGNSRGCLRFPRRTVHCQDYDDADLTNIWYAEVEFVDDPDDNY